MRALMMTLLAFVTTGCVSLNSLTPGNGEPVDRSYYVVDTALKSFCIGNTTECRDFTKIVSARTLLAPIEKAYGQKVKGPNYPASLANIVLNPQDKSYVSTAEGDGKRFYRVPKNSKTDIVWETVKEIELDLYNDKGTH